MDLIQGNEGAEAPFSVGKGIACLFRACQGQAASRFWEKSPPSGWGVKNIHIILYIFVPFFYLC
jgi:hypothetical protein